jgi:hypothetical protein
VSRPLVTYLRVSSAQQGRSSLGIDGQREALKRFALAEGFEVAQEFVEVETGKGADALERRPQLAAALKEARKRRCPVAVANPNGSKLLHYFSPEFTFADPNHRDWEFVVRYHHRSGVMGLFNSVWGGSNIVTGGVRHRF